MKSFHETLLQVYAAKKRAEAAPGVGRETDMVIIGPVLGRSEKISEEHLAKAEEIYQRLHKTSQDALDHGIKEAEEFVRKVSEDRNKKAKKGTKKSKLSPLNAQTATPEP